MPFSASPEPEDDWQSSCPCSGQHHWGTPCTREGWITSEDQAFIKDAEQMLKIIKDSLLGIKSMYLTLLSSSYFLFSLWYASAVSLYTFRHMFWLQEHHCTFPISCSGPGCLSFQPRLVLEGSRSSLKFPVLPPSQDVWGMEAEAWRQRLQPHSKSHKVRTQCLSPAHPRALQPSENPTHQPYVLQQGLKFF